MTVSTTRKRCGKSSPVSSAEHTTVRAAGCAVSTDTNSARVSAVSIMASSGWRMSRRIGWLPRPKTRLARASSSRLIREVGDGAGPDTIAAVASSRQTSRAWKTQRTSRR